MENNNFIDLNVTMGYLDKANLHSSDTMKYAFLTHSALVIVLEPERKEKLIQLISENEDVSTEYAAKVIDLVLNNLAQVMV